MSSTGLKPSMAKAWWVFSTLLYGVLAVFFGWAFYARYWHWRYCIADASSSCATPTGNNLIAGGAFWAVPAALFAGLCIRRIIQLRRRRRRA